MSVQCPYEGCDRSFPRNQLLFQHIHKSHSDGISGEISINKGDDAELLQDEKVFDLNLFSVSFEVK